MVLILPPHTCSSSSWKLNWVALRTKLVFFLLFVSLMSWINISFSINCSTLVVIYESSNGCHRNRLSYRNIQYSTIVIKSEIFSLYFLMTCPWIKVKSICVRWFICQQFACQEKSELRQQFQLQNCCCRIPLWTELIIMSLIKWNRPCLTKWSLAGQAAGPLISRLVFTWQCSGLLLHKLGA